MAAGIDLVFPHHENELAQAACAFHADRHGQCLDAQRLFLQVRRRQRMSKSEGNFVPHQGVAGGLGRGEVLRLSMLKTHLPDRRSIGR